MASQHSPSPHQQNRNDNRNDNNNNNNNNNNTVVPWQSFSCPRCRIRIAVFTGHWQFHTMQYSVLQPDARTLRYFRDPCVVLHNMVNVHFVVDPRLNVHLSVFENRATNVHCNRCAAFLGWKTNFRGRHYIPFVNVTLYGRIPIHGPRPRPNRNADQSRNGSNSSSNQSRNGSNSSSNQSRNGSNSSNADRRLGFR